MRNKVQRNGPAQRGALQAPVCKIHINGRLQRQIGYAHALPHHPPPISHTSKWIRERARTLTNDGVIKPILADGTLLGN